MSIEETKQLLEKNKGYLRVKVLPCSSKNEITDIMDNETVKIRIATPPEKGKANKELIKFLSKELNVPKDEIIIISGKTDQVKLLKISTET